MIQPVFFLIFTIVPARVECVTPIGYINNAAYVSNDTKVIITYQNACSECICNGFFSSVPSLYAGLNCYENNKTCELFTNYSTSLMVKININSTFIFLQQTPSQNTTTRFPLSGVTVGGYGNGTAGNASNSLKYPWGLALDLNDSLYVADYNNYRVMKLQDGSLLGAIVAGTGIGGSSTRQLRNPAELAADANSNIYINDDFNYRVMLWYKNSSSGFIVAGNGTSGNSTTIIGASVGLATDSQNNIYVSEYSNHRVMKWTPNATVGILVAGITGVAGNNTQQLNTPYGLYLDETNSYLYIADLNNHRIQRYTLGTAANGTTVAGGNGVGSGSRQLYEPHGVCVSKKTGEIYIADRRNHRIQRWSPGATSGVTVVGVTGLSGVNATLLNGPVNVLLNENETFLYVSDTNNNRVQRYRLI